jgi:hypothetical protein
MALNAQQQAAFDIVCIRIAGGESLRAVCELDDALPARETIRGWLRGDQDGELTGQYARARDEQADHYADEIIAIADEEPDPSKAKVRVDARKWVASKLKPRVYGDKIDHKHSGSLTIGIRHNDRVPDG